MDAPAIQLTVALHRSTLDARRGVVRIHPVILSTLGVATWDPLELRGRRTTGALVAPSQLYENIILLDDLICANARISEGDKVVVRRAEVKSAVTVEMTDLPPGGRLEPELLRVALLGKIVAPGDRVGLLPQDFSGNDAERELDHLVTYMQSSYGHEWQNIAVVVAAATPDGLVRVTMETEVVVRGGATAGSSTPIRASGPAAIEDLPGLEAQFDRLRELLDLAFNRPEVMLKLGVNPQLGILISGPPGSGKGALVEAVGAAVGAKVLRTWAPTLARAAPGAAEAELRSLILEAQSSAPAIVIIEDVEAIARRDHPAPLTSVILELIPSTTRDGRVAIVCTTSHPESASQELRRPGILDHALDIPLPHRAERRRILEVHCRGLPLAPDVTLDKVAANTPGFVAADIIALCREAALRAAQRTVKAGAPFIAHADFDAALEVIKPSTLDGLSVEVADVSMDDVGDMEAVKVALTEAVVWPLTYPETFDRMGVEPVKGVLLYGPPGCGKTFVVKALAHEVQANFLSVKGAELLSKWVGESERAVRELFRRARGAAPALIFFDEIDSLTPIRGGAADSNVTDRVVAALLTELDGIEDLPGVVVVGATNRPDLVDPALLRPGRLERLVYVPPPDDDARRAILAATARQMPLEPGVDLAAIASKCDGFSAADLEGLARRAAMVAMRESMDTPQVRAAHFEAARSECAPSLRPDVIARLERFAAGKSGA